WARELRWNSAALHKALSVILRGLVLAAPDWDHEHGIRFVEYWMSPAETILSIENLRRDFGGVAAVQGVCASVRRGSITSMIGPNGAGKTTVFNAITG